MENFSLTEHGASSWNLGVFVVNGWNDCRCGNNTEGQVGSFGCIAKFRTGKALDCDCETSCQISERLLSHKKT